MLMLGPKHDPASQASSNLRSVLGFSSGKLPWGFCLTWGFLAASLSLCSQDRVRAALLTALCHLLEAPAHGHALKGLGDDAASFGYLAVTPVSDSSPAASLFLLLLGELSLSLPGLSAFISPGIDFLSLSTKAQEERRGPFIHNWPHCGVEAVGVRVNVLQN